MGKHKLQAKLHANVPVTHTFLAKSGFWVCSRICGEIQMLVVGVLTNLWGEFKLLLLGSAIFSQAKPNFKIYLQAGIGKIL